MSTRHETKRQGRRPRPQVRRTLPAVEAVERRQMLDASGVLAGTVFADPNATGSFATSDGYLAGARIDLSAPGRPGVIASTITNALGAYSFSGLEAGDYLFTETPPSEYQAEASQAHSQVYAAAPVSATTVRVTVRAAGSLYVQNNGITGGSFSTNNVVNGAPTPNNDGRLSITLGNAPGGNDLNNGFLTLCVDDLTALSRDGGESFRVVTAPLTSLTNFNSATISPGNLGRIAYLYNHHANASLNGTQAPALQLAVWELVYDPANNLNLSTGHFQATGPYFDGQQPTFDQVMEQASAFLSESAGKSETALLLDARTPATTDHPAYSQSLLASNSFDFLNAPAPTLSPSPTPAPGPGNAGIGGYVYYDRNDNGIKEAGEPPIPGTTVDLTGTDNLGRPVVAHATTDATGHYQFDNLVPGVYSLHEIQPAHYDDGKDTLGTPGTGITGNDLFSSIVLNNGDYGDNNNFGETLPGRVVSESVGVSALTFYGIHHQQSTIVLNTHGALDPAQASNPASYVLTGLGKDQRLGTRDDARIPIKAALYDAVTGRLTLVPARHLDFHDHYLLQVQVPATAGRPALSYSEVFGRNAMTYWDYHGRTLVAPAMSATARHADQGILSRANAHLAAEGRTVGTAPTDPSAPVPALSLTHGPLAAARVALKAMPHAAQRHAQAAGGRLAHAHAH